MPKRLDDKVIIDDVLKVISDTNDFSFKNYKSKGKYTESTIIAHFKNWTSLLKSLNIDPKHDRFISKENIISDVMKIINETKNTTQENYIKYGKYSKAPIKRIFGSWNNLLKELNIKLNITNDYTKEDILNQYKQLCHENNKTLTAIEFRKLSNYSQPIIDRVFGSFTNLKKELNLSIDSRFVSDDELLNDLKQLYKQYGFINLDIIREFSIVSPPTIINRFGSIYKACELSDIPYNSNDNLSKFCKFVISICEKILGTNYELEYTFDWLVNPDTSRNLFIDIYYPDLKLAIEADGGQHDRYSAKYHKSIQDFNYAKKRDKTKDNLLISNNITVIRIKEGTKLIDIEKTLLSYSNG